uniref:Uncharacterized protein n=1 Tax=Trypanosoma vivax (strain Y486) TaxID=1055687 RepID=G0TYL7_TRYVY|nr:hypothetical protein TVY486_0703980 [Trypanosoma vivax Y486]
MVSSASLFVEVFFSFYSVCLFDLLRLLLLRNPTASIPAIQLIFILLHFHMIIISLAPHSSVWSHKHNHRVFFLSCCCCFPLTKFKCLYAPFYCFLNLIK